MEEAGDDDIPVLGIDECHVRWQNPHDESRGAKVGDPMASRVTESVFNASEEGVSNTIGDFSNENRKNIKLWLRGGKDFFYAGLVPWNIPTQEPMGIQLDLLHPDSIVTIILPSDNLETVSGPSTGMNKDVPAHGLRHRDKGVPANRVFTLAGTIYRSLTESVAGLDKGYLLFEMTDGSKLIIDLLSTPGMRKDTSWSVKDIFAAAKVPAETWIGPKYHEPAADPATPKEAKIPPEPKNWTESKGWGVQAKVAQEWRQEPAPAMSEEERKAQEQRAKQALDDKRRRIMALPPRGRPSGDGLSPGSQAGKTVTHPEKPDSTSSTPAASTTTAGPQTPLPSSTSAANPVSAMNPPLPPPGSATKRDAGMQPMPGPAPKKPGAAPSTNAASGARSTATPPASSTPRVQAPAPAANQASTPARQPGSDKKRKGGN